MTKPLRIEEDAEKELAAAAEWYECQRNGLGKEFLNAVEGVLGQIRERPLLGVPVPGTPVDSSVRRLLMRRFPYSVVYLELPDEIRVLAFAHARRSPGYWQNR